MVFEGVVRLADVYGIAWKREIVLVSVGRRVGFVWAFVYFSSR